MALIKCPECGAPISDQASACIHCGYLLKETTGFVTEEWSDVAAGTPEQAQPLAVAEKAGEAAAGPGNEARRRFNLKVLLVLILGGVLWIVKAITIISGFRGFDLVCTFLMVTFAIVAMILFTLRKKIPAIILAAGAVQFLFLDLFVFLISMGDSFSYIFSYFSFWFFQLVDISQFGLLLIYTILADRHRDSIIWLIIFLGSNLVYMIYNLIIGGFDIGSLILWLLLNVGFFAIGYSPDKWYRRNRAEA